MINTLREMGLTVYESKIYKSLLVWGAMGAKEISTKSQVPITAVYPNLNGLVEKKLVQKSSGKVAAFLAIEPKVALARYVAQKQQDLLRVKEQTLREIKDLEKHALKKDKEMEVVQVSLGKMASSELYDHLLEGAKESVYICGWHMKRVGDRYRKIHQYKEAIARGLDVRIITIGDTQKHAKLIEMYLSFGVKIRYLGLQNFSLVVSDKRECKITLKRRSLQEKVNIHVQDPSLAAAMQGYFMSLWREAVPIERIIGVNKQNSGS